MNGLLNRPTGLRPNGPWGLRAPVPDPNISCWKVTQLRRDAKQNHTEHKETQREAEQPRKDGNRVERESNTSTNVSNTKMQN